MTLLDFLTKHLFTIPENLNWFAMDLSGHIWGYSKKPSYDDMVGQWIPAHGDDSHQLILRSEMVSVYARNEVLPHAEDSLIHKHGKDVCDIGEEPPENYYDFYSSEDAIRAMLDGYKIKSNLGDGRFYYYCNASKRFMEKFDDDGSSMTMSHFIAFGEVGWDFYKEQYVKWIKVNTFNRMGATDTTSTIVELKESETPKNGNGVYWIKMDDI